MTRFARVVAGRFPEATRRVRSIGLLTCSVGRDSSRSPPERKPSAPWPQRGMASRSTLRPRRHRGGTGKSGHGDHNEPQHPHFDRAADDHEGPRLSDACPAGSAERQARSCSTRFARSTRLDSSRNSAASMPRRPSGSWTSCRKCSLGSSPAGRAFSRRWLPGRRRSRSGRARRQGPSNRRETARCRRPSQTGRRRGGRRKTRATRNFRRSRPACSAR